MAYGHAERALATIRLLEAETAALLNSLPELDAEQRAWLDEVSGTGPHRSGAPGTPGTARPPGRVADADLAIR